MNMPVYVISLARAADRRAGIIDRLTVAGMKYEIVDAVDGETLDLNSFGDRLVNRSMTKGAIGCFLSHYNLWQRMIAEQIPTAIVLEDDALWDEDFFEVAENCRRWTGNGILSIAYTPGLSRLKPFSTNSVKSAAWFAENGRLGS